MNYHQLFAENYYFCIKIIFLRAELKLGGRRQGRRQESPKTAPRKPKDGADGQVWRLRRETGDERRELA